MHTTSASRDSVPERSTSCKQQTAETDAAAADADRCLAREFTIADGDDGYLQSLHRTCFRGQSIRAENVFLHCVKMIRAMHARRGPRVAGAAPSCNEQPAVEHPRRSAPSAAVRTHQAGRQAPSETQAAAADNTRRALLVAAPTAAISGLLEARPADAIKEIKTPDGRQVQAREPGQELQTFARHPSMVLTGSHRLAEGQKCRDRRDQSKDRPCTPEVTHGNLSQS